MIPIPPLPKIIWTVFFFHLLFVGFLFLRPSPILPPASKKRITVHTIATKDVQKHSPPKKNKIATQKPKKKSSIKKKVAIQKPKKKSSIKKKTTTKKKPNNKRKKLLEQAKKAMEKVEAIDTASLPTPTIQLHPSSLSSQEASYTDRLISTLQSRLRLPEQGEVEVSLTVSRQGSIKQIKIIQSNSDVNKKYVQETLPRVMLPPFDRHFSGRNEHSFSITLSSER